MSLPYIYPDKTRCNKIDPQPNSCDSKQFNQLRASFPGAVIGYNIQLVKSTVFIVIYPP